MHKIAKQSTAMPLLVCTVFALFATLVSLATFVPSIMGVVSASNQDAFRRTGELFATRLDQGWSLVSAPAQGEYQIIGATESDPSMHLDSFEGSFATGDRSVSFNVEVPEGQVIAVEGLKPLGGGPLTFAVLARDLRGGETPQSSSNQEVISK